MKISELTRHLNIIKEEYGDLEVKIPRLGCYGVHDITEEELYSDSSIHNGILAIEGEFNYNYPNTMRPSI